MNISPYKKIAMCIVLSTMTGNILLADQLLVTPDEKTVKSTTSSSEVDNKVSPDNITRVNKITALKLNELLSNANIKSRIGNAALLQFYDQYNHSYAFINDSAGQLELSNNAKILSEILTKSHEDGLNPNHYHSEIITKSIADFSSATPEQRETLEILLTDAFLSYARDMGKGRPELKRNDPEWLLKGRNINEVKLLIKALKENTINASLQSLTPKYPVYAALKAQLPKYQDLAALDAKLPKIQSDKRLQLNSSSPAIVTIRERLIANGVLAADQNKSDLFDKGLETAVKEYQKSKGLDADGKIGPTTLMTLNLSAKDQLAQIEINMERWRWMPESLGDFYLVVDITGFEYFIMKDGIETLRSKIVVGTAQRPTPVFSADMNHIVFSPYWNVPNSIAIKDKLPLLRSDPYRLARSGIRIYDRKGNEIDPGMVDWENYSQASFNYALRQDPGTNNALGRVKFMFPNNHAIYLHDTPTRSLFNKKIRTYSSGCIRVENPLELAEYLLKDKSWDAERIKKAYNLGKENSVQLGKNMRFPVIILYMTAWANDKGVIDFRPDIYQRDAKMMNALKNVNQYAEKI